MKRANPRGCQFVRGFLLGMLYERGHTITTARIRRELRASRATAKRDMKHIRTLVPALPRKPLASARGHAAQRTVRTWEWRR
jgi:hypothetical protein